MENNIRRILEELVQSIQGGDLTVYSKEMIDDALAQIKSEMRGCVPEEREDYDSIPKVVSFNQCRTETLARIELKFKEEKK